MEDDGGEWWRAARAEAVATDEWAAVRPALLQRLAERVHETGVGLLDLTPAERQAFVDQATLDLIAQDTAATKAFVAAVGRCLDHQLAERVRVHMVENNNNDEADDDDSKAQPRSLVELEEASAALSDMLPGVSADAPALQLLVNGFVPARARPGLWATLLDSRSEAKKAVLTDDGLVADAALPLLTMFRERTAAVGVLDAAAMGSTQALALAKTLLAVFFSSVARAAPNDARYAHVFVLVAPLVYVFHADTETETVVRRFRFLLRLLPHAVDAPSYELWVIARRKRDARVGERVGRLLKGDGGVDAEEQALLGDMVETLFAGILPLETCVCVWDTLLLSRMALLEAYMAAALELRRRGTSLGDLAWDPLRVEVEMHYMKSYRAATKRGVAVL